MIYRGNEIIVISQSSAKKTHKKNNNKASRCDTMEKDMLTELKQYFPALKKLQNIF